MSALEFNKIIASIIIAIIVFVVIGFVGNFLVNTNNNDEQQTAYKIDINEISSNSSNNVSSEEKLVESIDILLSTASIENGEKIFKKCSSCHNYTKGSKSKVGPNLWDIINRPKANIDGFAYSKSLATHGGQWSYEDLNNFLYKPKDYIAGTKMNFSGLKKAEDRADVILWMRENSDNPIALP